MNTTTIRELKHRMTAVLARVAAGETLEIRRRNRPIALLTPPKPASAIERPDFAGRLRQIYGDLELTTTGTSVVSESRGEF